MQLYNEHIDNKGHQFGPTSDKVKQAVKEIDYHLDRFLTMLEHHNLSETVIQKKPQKFTKCSINPKRIFSFSLLTILDFLYNGNCR